MATMTEAAPGVGLEPIDIYGNWKVTDIKLQPPPKPFGIEKAKSKFKIRNKQAQHVLVKKKDVAWNGNQNEIVLTEVASTGTDAALFNNNFRLKAVVTFGGLNHEVALGSDDNGVSLKIQVVSQNPSTDPGGTGVAGRG